MYSRYLFGKFSTVILLISLFMMGCGGGGSNTPKGGTSVTTEQRAAGLNDATAELYALRKSGLSGDALHQALAEHLKKNPVFSEAGLSGTAVWAKFKDGLYMTIPTNDVEDSSVNRSSTPTEKKLSKISNIVAKSNFEIPLGSNAYLFDSINGGSSDINNMKSILESKGYNVTVGSGSLPELRKIQQCGFLYMEAHGSEPKDKVFCVYTSSKFPYRSAPTASNPNNIEILPDPDVENQKDIKNSALNCMLARTKNSSGKYSEEWHYTINSNFVETRLANRFTANSLAYFTVCNSYDEIASSFRKSFLNTAKAGMYMGWTKPVIQSHGGRAARAIVALATGKASNTNYPGSDPQHPVDFLTALSLVRSVGWGVDSGSTLQSDPFENTDTGIFAPSISDTEIDYKTRKLTLKGTFGNNPGTDGSVTLSGPNGDIKLSQSEVTWDAAQLVCETTNYTHGTYDVFVTVRKHESNKTSVELKPGALNGKWYGSVVVPATGECSDTQFTYTFNIRDEFGTEGGTIPATWGRTNSRVTRGHLDLGEG